jgi:hypothetical protein
MSVRFDFHARFSAMQLLDKKKIILVQINLYGKLKHESFSQIQRLPTFKTICRWNVFTHLCSKCRHLLHTRLVHQGYLLKLPINYFIFLFVRGWGKTINWIDKTMKVLNMTKFNSWTKSYFECDAIL